MGSGGDAGIKREWVFLPGASGSRSFWQPVVTLLGVTASARILGYPGFDGVARVANVDGMDSLATWVTRQLTGPTILVAQSMGGILAMMATLAQPQGVTHLVLVATSAGVDMAALGAEDWVPAYRQAHGSLPDWFCTFDGDLSADLPQLALPILLLWGEDDAISPVAVGQRLAALLPQSRLDIIAGGQHDVATTHAAEVAGLIQAFIHTTP